MLPSRCQAQYGVLISGVDSFHIVSFPQDPKPHTSPTFTRSSKNRAYLILPDTNANSHSVSSTCHLVIRRLYTHIKSRQQERPPPYRPHQQSIFPACKKQTPIPRSPPHPTKNVYICRKSNPFNTSPPTPPHTPPRATTSHPPTPILPRRSSPQAHSPTFLVRSSIPKHALVSHSYANSSPPRI